MTENTDDGGPAFPVNDLSGYSIGPGFPAHGMTLMDWFAGQALAGLLAHDGDEPEVAKWAYAIASDMIKERAKARGGSHEQAA